MRTHLANRLRSTRSNDDGTVLVSALIFVTVFALLSGFLFSVLSTSASGNTVTSGIRNEQIVADNASALAVATLRRAPNPTTACANLATYAASMGDARLSSECTMVTPPAAPPANQGLAVLALSSVGTALTTDAGFTARIDGDVWVNGSTATGPRTEVKGDILVRGNCANLFEVGGGDGSTACRSGADTPVLSSNATLVSTTGTARTVPSCSSFPVETNPVVALEPGAYGNAAALNQLFTDCAGRDFWFKPGSFIFNFSDTTASQNCGSSAVVSSQRLLCLGRGGSRVVAGTPQGWDTTIPVTAHNSPWGTATAGPGSTWTNVSNSRVINVTHAHADVGTTSRTRPAQAVTATGSPTFSPSVANLAAPDGNYSAAVFPAPAAGGTGGTSLVRATTASGFTNSTGALAIESIAASNVAYHDTYNAATPASLKMGGFQSTATGTYQKVLLKTRIYGETYTFGSLKVTITTPSGTCPVIDLKSQTTTDAHGYQLGSFDVTSCVSTYAALSNSNLSFDIAGSTLSEVISVDGMEFEVTGGTAAAGPAPVAEVHLSNFASAVAVDPHSTAIALTGYRVADASAELVLSGSVNCSYPLALTTTNSLITTDVSACVNTAAKANGLTVTVRATGSTTEASQVVLDAVRLTHRLPTAPQRIDFTDVAPTIPATAYRINSASILYDGRHVATDRVTLSLSSNGVAACPPIVINTTVEASTYDLMSCLEPHELPNLTATLEATSTEPLHRLSVDGVVLRVNYNTPRRPIPALGLGCAPTSPGTQIVFRSEARMAVTSGETTICAPPASPWGVSSVSPTGCVSTQTCPLLTTHATLGKLSIQGGIHTGSSVSVGDSSYSVPLVTRGIVANRVHLTQSTPAAGYTGSWITAPGFTHDGFQVALTTRSGGSNGVPLTSHTQEVVNIGSSIRGRKVGTITWGAL